MNMDPRLWRNNLYDQQQRVQHGKPAEFRHELRQMQSQLLGTKIEYALLRAEIDRFRLSLGHDFREVSSAFHRLQGLTKLREIELKSAKDALLEELNSSRSVDTRQNPVATSADFGRQLQENPNVVAEKSVPLSEYESLKSAYDQLRIQSEYLYATLL
jgi:hypothetical protein